MFQLAPGRLLGIFINMSSAMRGECDKFPPAHFTYKITQWLQLRLQQPRHQLSLALLGFVLRHLQHKQGRKHNTEVHTNVLV